MSHGPQVEKSWFTANLELWTDIIGVVFCCTVAGLGAVLTLPGKQEADRCQIYQKKFEPPYFQVCTFHDGCKQGIDQQIFSSQILQVYVNVLTMIGSLLYKGKNICWRDMYFIEHVNIPICDVRYSGDDSKGGPGWAMPPPDFCLAPRSAPPVFFLISCLSSFGWHIRFAKCVL